MLRELIKSTNETHPDYKNLEKALTKIQTVVTIVNDGARKAESVHKILDIQSKLTNKSSIIAPTRSFIRNGTIDLLVGNDTKKREIYLFNDMLMIGKVYDNGGIKPIATVSFDMLLVNTIPDGTEGKGRENLFQIVHIGVAKYTLMGDCPFTKEQWVKSLTEATNAWVASKATSIRAEQAFQPIEKKPEKDNLAAADSTRLSTRSQSKPELIPEINMLIPKPPVGKKPPLPPKHIRPSVIGPAPVLKRETPQVAPKPHRPAVLESKGSGTNLVGVFKDSKSRNSSNSDLKSADVLSRSSSNGEVSRSGLIRSKNASCNDLAGIMKGNLEVSKSRNSSNNDLAGVLKNNFENSRSRNTSASDLSGVMITGKRIDGVRPLSKTYDPKTGGHKSRNSSSENLNMLVEKPKSRKQSITEQLSELKPKHSLSQDVLTQRHDQRAISNRHSTSPEVANKKTTSNEMLVEQPRHIAQNIFIIQDLGAKKPSRPASASNLINREMKPSISQQKLNEKILETEEVNDLFKFAPTFSVKREEPIIDKSDRTSEIKRASEIKNDRISIQDRPSTIATNKPKKPLKPVLAANITHVQRLPGTTKDYVFKN